MHYSYRIEQALRAAAILHKDQVRKGDIPYPYITHVYAVTLIVSDYTDKEEVVIAALLHDTLEDTDYTKEELNEDFGHEVLQLVESVTNVLTEEGSWVERKKEYLVKLKEASSDALLIAAADKIHNMRTMVEAYYDKDEQFSADFGGSLNDRLMMYQEISNIFNRKLNSDILSEFNYVFEEFKQFVLESEKKREAREKGY